MALSKLRMAALAAALVVPLLVLPARLDAQLDIQVGGQEMSLSGDVKPLRAIRITLSGEARFDFVYRSDKYFDAALGDAITGAAGSPLGWDSSTTAGANGSDSFVMPWISLNIDTQLSEDVNAMITLETPFDEWAENVGGSGSGRQLDVEQAYVRWIGAFVPDLTLVIGIQDYTVDFAGNGEPFFIDVSEAESAFGNPTGGTSDFGSPQSTSSGLPSSQEAAGALGQVQLGDVELDLFYFVLDETFRDDEDEAMFGAVLDYVFETQSWNGTLGVLVVDLQNTPSSSLWTYGGGGHLETASRDFRIYGEAYGQFGKYQNNLSGFGDITQSRSFGAFGGLRYHIGGQGEMRPWFDVSYWEISGDDRGNDDENGNFVSLEGNNSTIVVEDNYYGLDIDTNYRAIKGKTGMNLTNDWSLEALYAFFEFQDNSNGLAGNNTTRDKLGEEIDVNVNFRATDYLSFRLGSGWLIDPVGLGLSKTINVTVLSAEVRF